MTKRERLDYLIKVVSENENISKKMLQMYATSKGFNNMIFWRDLKELTDKKYLVNDFGIIRLIKNVDGNIEQGRTFKYELNKVEKELTAQKALSSLKENSVIFISTGTTLEALVRMINVPIKCVITNGIEILNIASKNRNIENVIILGGQYNLRSHGIFGNDAIFQINSYSLDQIYTSATAIDKRGIVYNNTMGESQLMQHILEKSSEKYLLIDHTKINKSDINYCVNYKVFTQIFSDDEEKINDFLTSIDNSDSK